jgi:amino acid permease
MLELLACIIVGFLAGKFLALPVLVIITLICIIAGINLFFTIGWQLDTLFFSVGAFIFNLAIWGTYYLVTQQQWLGDFLSKYIFR